MKVIYRACDGTEFTSEEACSKYEKETLFPQGVLMFDFDGDEMNPFDDPMSVKCIINQRSLSLQEQDNVATFLCGQYEPERYSQGYNGARGVFIWKDSLGRYVFFNSAEASILQKILNTNTFVSEG